MILHCTAVLNATYNDLNSTHFHTSRPIATISSNCWTATCYSKWKPFLIFSVISSTKVFRCHFLNFNFGIRTCRFLVLNYGWWGVGNNNMKFDRFENTFFIPSKPTELKGACLLIVSIENFDKCKGIHHEYINSYCWKFTSNSSWMLDLLCYSTLLLLFFGIRSGSTDSLIWSYVLNELFMTILFSSIDRDVVHECERSIKRAGRNWWRCSILCESCAHVKVSSFVFLVDRQTAKHQMIFNEEEKSSSDTDRDQ